MLYTVKKNAVLQGLGGQWDSAVFAGSSPHGLESRFQPLAEQVPADIVLVRGLLDEAVSRSRAGELERTTSLDQWLAPRIHSALRLPRRVAGEMGFWTWLLLEVGRPYTYYRWPERNGRPTPYRYIGDFKRNALSRLWWFAEMARNGSSYAPVKDVLRGASTAQYAMELRYSMYRPAVIAFGRVAREGDLDFASLKTLSKRINAYLSLRSLEEIGLHVESDIRDDEWWTYQPRIEELLGPGEPIGPLDGLASQNAIDDLAKWFTALIPARAAA